MSFAIGHRFAALMPRQAEIARPGLKGGGFAPPEEDRRKPREPALFVLDVGDRWNPPLGRSIWAAGFAGQALRHPDTAIGGTRQTTSFGAVAAGVDFRVSTHLLAGVALGFGTGDFAAGSPASNGDARSALFGLYGSWSADALHIDAALSYAYIDYSTTRIIGGAAVERADGNFSGHLFGGRVEAGWRALEVPFVIRPFGALAAQWLRQADYTERSKVVATGAPGTLGQSFAGATTWSIRSELGIQIQQNLFFEMFSLIGPRVRIAWAHEFSTGRVITAGAVSPGARAAPDALLVSAGVTFWLGSGVNGYAQFDGEWSSTGRSYTGGAGLRASW